MSPKLSEIQAQMLTGGKVQSNPEDKSVYMKGISKTGIPIFWYRDIQDVPLGKELQCLATGPVSFLHLQLLIMEDISASLHNGCKSS